MGRVVFPAPGPSRAQVQLGERFSINEVSHGERGKQLKQREEEPTGQRRGAACREVVGSVYRLQRSFLNHPGTGKFGRELEFHSLR